MNKKENRGKAEYRFCATANDMANIKMPNGKSPRTSKVKKVKGK